MRHGGRIVPKSSRPRMCMHLKEALLLSASRIRKLTEIRVKSADD